MEILIPGLILVGLMVYASTKIKKIAARAYERETVETPDFSISKPDGFICPVDPTAGLLFAAYSKEYGNGSSRKLAGRHRPRSARLRRRDLRTFAKRVKRDAVRVASENIGVLNGAKSSIIEAEREENGVILDITSKIMARGEKVFELNIAVLPEHKDEFARKVDELASSFILK